MTDPDRLRTDPLVDRVNELTTTFLDTAATLAFGVGAWVWADRYLGTGMPWVSGGFVLFAYSWLAQWRNRSRVPKSQRTATSAEIPGPSHAGTVHIAGGR